MPPSRTAFLWIAPGVNLGFVKESRPTTMRDLLRDGKWQSLFGMWMKHRYGQHLPAWKAMQVDYAKYRSATRVMKGMTSADKAVWDARVEEFRATVGQLRQMLEEEEKQAKRNLGAKASHKDIAAERDRLVQVSMLDARMKPPDQAGPDAWEGGIHGKNGLINLEGQVIRGGLELKRSIAEFYQFVTQSGICDGQAVATLEESIALTQTAEASLRRACSRFRGTMTAETGTECAKCGAPNSLVRRRCIRCKARLAGQDQYTYLENAWIGYLEAYKKLGVALRLASRQCIRWAEKDTRKKIQKNSAAAMPELSAALLAVDVMVTSLSTFISVLGVIGTGATANPAVILAAEAVSNALVAASDICQRLVISLTAKAMAQNPNVVLKHVGRQYETPRTKRAERGEKAAKETGFAVNAVGQAIAPGLQWLADATRSPTGAAARIAPVAGHIWRIGDIAVKFNDLVNPNELEDGEQREEFVAGLKHAYGNLQNPGKLPETITVLSVNGDAYHVDIGGVRGTIQNGRFSPDDRTDSFRDCIAAWQRELTASPQQTGKGATTDAGLAVKLTSSPIGYGDRVDIKLQGGAFGRFSDLLADPDLLPHQEDGGDFLITAHGSIAGHDSWKTTFRLRPDGSTKVEGLQFETYMLMPQGASTALWTDQLDIAEVLMGSSFMGDTDIMSRFDQLKDHYGWPANAYRVRGDDMRIEDPGSPGQDLLYQQGVPVTIESLGPALQLLSLFIPTEAEIAQLTYNGQYVDPSTVFLNGRGSDTWDYATHWDAEVLASPALRPWNEFRVALPQARTALGSNDTAKFYETIRHLTDRNPNAAALLASFPDLWDAWQNVSQTFGAWDVLNAPITDDD